MANFDAEKRARWEGNRAVFDAPRAASLSIPVSRIHAVLNTPEQFEAWLAQQSPEVKVGDVITPDDCPIANFLWDILGIYVWVGDTILYKRIHITHVPYPQWVNTLLLKAWDQVESRQNSSVDISAEDLLTILEAMRPNAEHGR
jgi:hypothetical protein